MAGAISAAAAKALAHAPGEVAFLDVREHGQYGEGHPFLAVPCPFSRLELAIGGLVPRRSVPILLIDDGDGVAERAAAALTSMGYRDVAWIDGGSAAWAAAGFTLFKGVNLPSKTLGELLEETWHVPHIDVGTLDAWQREGRPLRLFDGRPAAEYRKSTIPGARSLPNGELPHRYDATVRDGTTPVIVHCAGRTRSIVGAAGLALAGVGNPIFALENGTQGWALSGRKLSYENDPAPLPELTKAGQDLSRRRALSICDRYSIPIIGVDELSGLAHDASRTLYLLDVRSSQEFAAGAFAGARHAPSVQLAQATDQWIGVRRSRVVLTCDTGLRSAITAVFLRALNFEVYVLPGADEKGDAGLTLREPPDLLMQPLPSAGAAEALNAASDGAALVDLRGSLAYRDGHLDGAVWSIRPKLGRLKLDRDRPVFLIGPSSEVGLAARDLLANGYQDIRHVMDDADAWRANGLPIVATPNAPGDAEAIDFLFFVHDRHDGNMESARRYLEWEQGLLAQLDEAEKAEFKIGPSPFG